MGCQSNYSHAVSACLDCNIQGMNPRIHSRSVWKLNCLEHLSSSSFSTINKHFPSINKHFTSINKHFSSPLIYKHFPSINKHFPAMNKNSFSSYYTPIQETLNKSYISYQNILQNKSCFDNNHNICILNQLPGLVRENVLLNDNQFFSISKSLHSNHTFNAYQSPVLLNNQNNNTHLYSTTHNKTFSSTHQNKTNITGERNSFSSFSKHMNAKNFLSNKHSLHINQNSSLIIRNLNFHRNESSANKNRLSKTAVGTPSPFYQQGNNKVSLKKSTKTKTPTISMISLNCQSLKNKIVKVMEYIEDKKADLVFLQETWLKSADKSIYARIKNDYNYDIIKKMREEGKGGGLAILFKCTVQVNECFKSKKAVQTFEITSALLQINSKTIRLINLYRRPYCNKHRCTETMFINEFEEFLTEISQENEYLILVGDFNINYQNKNNSITSRFNSLLLSFNLTQLVQESTHIKNGILDLVIMDNNLDVKTFSVAVDKTFKTDHYPICITMEGQTLQQSKTVKFIRDFKDLNLELFQKDLCEDLKNFDFSRTNSVSEYVEKYNTTMYTLRDKHCKEKKKVYRSNRIISKWYNGDLQRLKKRKRQAERCFNKNKTIVNRNNYKRIRNLYNLEVEKTRSTYYSDTLLACQKDSKLMFNKLNKLTGNYKERILPSMGNAEQLANDFADYFSNKIEKIRNSISISGDSIKHIQRYDSPDDFSNFSLITPIELKATLAKIKSKTSKLDIFPTEIIKKCDTVLNRFLLGFINSSFSNSIFPASLKHSIVTPIIKDKRKDANDLSNYRPVCSGPLLGKLLERFAFDQLGLHIERQRLHAANQSAYRKNYSCETSMFKLIGDIQHLLEYDHCVILISLDSSAAFDTVDHKILIQRLRNDFHVTKNALNWIESYLKNRTFSVEINGKESHKKRVQCGVPQGSQLGPLFYILYTAEIERIVHNSGLEIQMYADDTQIYVSFSKEDIENAENIVRRCLQNIKSWMDNSYLKLNDQKTQFTVFYSSSNFSLHRPLELKFRDDDEAMLMSKELKILGINLSSNIQSSNRTSLNFESFISKKAQGCYFHLKNFNNIRKSLPVTLRITLVTTMILSRLDYCNATLVGTTGQDIKPLERVLNKSVRFIFNIRKREHVTPYLFKLHFLPIRFRINFKVCLLAFKIKEKISPDYLIETFQNFEPTTAISLRPGHGRDGDMFESFPIFMKNRTLFCKLVQKWNELPLKMRKIESLNKFKTELKTYYFKLAFPNLV